MRPLEREIGQTSAEMAQSHRKDEYTVARTLAVELRILFRALYISAAPSQWLPRSKIRRRSEVRFFQKKRNIHCPWVWAKYIDFFLQSSPHIMSRILQIFLYYYDNWLWCCAPFTPFA